MKKQDESLLFDYHNNLYITYQCSTLFSKWNGFTRWSAFTFGSISTKIDTLYTSQKKLCEKSK